MIHHRVIPHPNVEGAHTISPPQHGVYIIVASKEHAEALAHKRNVDERLKSEGVQSGS